MTPQEDVRAFMTLFEQERHDRPTAPSEVARELRIRLIREEDGEFLEASGYRQGRHAWFRFSEPDLVRVADALVDLLYVVYGAAETYGLDLAPLWHIVHRANMAKGRTCERCRGDGRLRNEDDPCCKCQGLGRIVIRAADGKILKPEGWQAPEEDIAAEIARQRGEKR